MRVLSTEADIAEGLAWLGKRDRRLRPVIATAGAVPLRRRGYGFSGLARIVVGQQVSLASAEAIWRRFEAAHAELEPHSVAASGDEALRAVGLSAAKIRTLRALADACMSGLNVNALAELPAEEARERLMAIKGIGPWTADIYLLFCLGHADVMPSGDLALQASVAAAFSLPERPNARALGEIAGRWSPWRGVAACLFWAYYRAIKNRQALPV